MIEYPLFEIDSDCIKCKLCAFIADDNFEIASPNIAKVIKQPDSKDEFDSCVEAAENCPVGAISY